MAGSSAMIAEPSIYDLVDDYLTLRRQLGFELREHEQALWLFAKYIEETEHHGPITVELAVRWATAANKSTVAARRLQIVRQFAVYRRQSDPGTEVPPKGLLSIRQRRRIPHIYSEAEVTAIARAASRLRPSHGLRPHVSVALFGLLASAGLRISEALRLTRADVDLDTGLCRVAKGKFGKSRVIPLSASTTQALRKYTDHRDRFDIAGRTTAFFVTDSGALRYTQAASAFFRIRSDLQWNGRARRRPRIHDLRHTFAVRRLIRWLCEGVDVDTKIGTLATYLGHTHVRHTYWYLTAIPELLAIAGHRFEQYSSATRPLEVVR